MAGNDAGWLEIADLVLKILAGVGAIFAFIVGIRQYERGQAWHRAEVVISLIDSFNNDPKIQAACQMLDWDERRIKIDGNKELNFRNDMLASALRVSAMDRLSTRTRGVVSEGESKPFTEDEMIIRDDFDTFFDFFDKLYALERSRLLDFSDYSYFFYWLELVRNAGKYKDDAKIQEAVDAYIRAYNFFGIRNLLREYGNSPQPLDIMEEATP